MQTLPEIGEETIQAWVGNKAFQRGYQYYEDDAILNPRRRGNHLIAECQGSQMTPYRVETTLGETGILWGICSCPAGEGGHCKHAAALLLTWIYEPILFSQVPELDEVLQNRSKEELAELILQMIARHPDLEQILELSALSNLSKEEELSAEDIIQQVKRAFSAAGGEWGDYGVIADALQPILDLGEAFLEREDLRNASIVFQTLLEALLTYEDSLSRDDSGVLVQVLTESEQGLEDCLEELTDPALRLKLFQCLFEFYLWDLTGGRHGFADETPLIIIEQSTPEEKQTLSDWVRAALKDTLPEDGDFNTQKNRRKLGGLLLELLNGITNGTVDDEDYLGICRETGRTQDMVDRLLALDRVDEALAAAHAEPVDSVLPMAELFEKYGRDELAWHLVKERTHALTDAQSLLWMKEYAARHDRPLEALELAEILFWQMQTLENYQVLVECAEELTQRSSVRTRVLERLESAGNFPLLVEIYLSENEADLALATLERVNAEIWWDRIRFLRSKVAQAVEISRPREAIRLYLMLTENLIGQRSRGSYAEAARFLQQIRKLYQSLGETESWRQLMSAYTQAYRRLPALRDELRRASLIDA